MIYLHLFESVFQMELKLRAVGMGQETQWNSLHTKIWPIDVCIWEITVGRLQRYHCVHGNIVWNLSDVILLPRGGGGGYPCGKSGLLGHNSPFNDVFPWLPVSCLKDEQSFISGSRGQPQFILVSSISCMRASITLSQSVSSGCLIETKVIHVPGHLCGGLKTWKGCVPVNI